MKMFSKKSAVIFGAAMAVCAFAVPSRASAAIWGPNSTQHILTSNSFAFTVHTPIGTVGSSCADSRLVADVGAPGSPVLTITTAAFNNCSGTGLAAGCTATMTATNLDWTATALTTTGVAIEHVDFDVFYETRAGSPLGSCWFENQSARVTGTLNGGVWTAATRTVDFSNATGLFEHTPVLGNGLAVTVTGFFFDSTGTLTLT